MAFWRTTLAVAGVTLPLGLDAAAQPVSGLYQTAGIPGSFSVT